MITEKEALEIMKTMDIPLKRVEEKDWFWLLRNIWVRNSEHGRIEEVHEFIKSKCKMIREKGYKED